MLSILIPTYNYNVLPLVQELQDQAKREHIEFEVIVLDDASTDMHTVSKNQQIALIDNCSYKLLQQNIGRSKIRNLLAKKAKYSWLLFFDADTIPITTDLICQYLQYLNAEEKVVSGGIEYQSKKPAKEMMLRWVYGRSREALNSHIREDAPYLSLLTMNFAISKSIFEKVVFNETIPTYGYEDMVFSYNLSQSHIRVQHIHNPVCHLGLETSQSFLNKTQEALGVYKYLIHNHILPTDYTRLGSAYDKIKRSGSKGLVVTFFNMFKKRLLSNLLGNRPSLLLFDLYRLGYLCTLK